jgi:hypothetical protein
MESPTIENMDHAKFEDETKPQTMFDKVQAFSIKEKWGPFILIAEHGGVDNPEMSIVGSGGLDALCKFSKHLDCHINNVLSKGINGIGRNTNEAKDSNQ